MPHARRRAKRAATPDSAHASHCTSQSLGVAKAPGSIQLRSGTIRRRPCALRSALRLSSRASGPGRCPREGSLGRCRPLQQTPCGPWDRGVEALNTPREAPARPRNSPHTAQPGPGNGAQRMHRIPCKRFTAPSLDLPNGGLLGCTLPAHCVPHKRAGDAGCSCIRRAWGRAAQVRDLRRALPSLARKWGCEPQTLCRMAVGPGMPQRRFGIARGASRCRPCSVFRLCAIPGDVVEEGGGEGGFGWDLPLRPGSPYGPRRRRANARASAAPSPQERAVCLPPPPRALCRVQSARGGPSPAQSRCQFCATRRCGALCLGRILRVAFSAPSGRK